MDCTKFFIVIALCAMTSVAYAQSNDTAVANQYYQQAVELFGKEDTSQQKFDLINQAYEMYEQRPFSREKAAVMSLYAYSNYSETDNDLAKSIATQVIEDFQKQFQITESEAIAYSYFTLQLSYLHTDYKLSASYGEKAMKCFGSNREVYYIAAELTLRNYGFSQAPDKIKNLLDQLEDDLASKPDSKYWIVFYRGKMQFNYNNYSFEEAIIWAKKLFAENEKHQYYSSHTLAPLYVEVSNMYSGLGQFEEAVKWVNKGIESTDFTEEDPALGSFYANLAYVYQKKNDYDLAIKYYNKSVDLMLKDEATFQNLIGIIYSNVSQLHYNQKDYKKAKETVELKTKYGITVGDEMVLANCYYEEKAYQDAVQLAHKIIIKVSKHFEDTLVTSNPSKYESYEYVNVAGRMLTCKGKSLCEIGKAKGDVKTIEIGIEALELAKDIYHKKGEETQGFQQSKYVVNRYELVNLDAIAKGYHTIYSIDNEVSSFNDFFKTIEQRKAIQLIETLTPSYLPEAIYEEEKNLVKKIQLAGQDLDLATFQGQKDSIDYYQEQLFQANQALDNFIKKIKRDYPKQTADIYETNYATIQDIQAVLAPQTLFVSYSMVNDELMISTVSQHTKNIYVLPLVENLKEKVEQLTKLIQSDLAFQTKKREAFITVSNELYQILIKPIQSEITDKTTLMIVPEGKLFNIPFEVLLATNDKKAYSELDFLIKKYNINYHYSATAFLKLQAKSTPKDNSFLGFAPVFKEGEALNEATRSLDFMIDSLYRSIEDNEFVPLPNTKREVNTIEKMLRDKGKTRVLLQEEATKKGLESALKQEYQFVHIATHGIVNFKNPKLSALACYSANNEMDNLYYANEIQNSKIVADLVVLSSCESGIGQLVASEGLVALNRSFLYSGAKNVLFSLWKVDDKWSSELMIDFYKNYLDGKSYTEALRAAKLELLTNPVTAEPKYWAAFVLMGE